MILEMIGGGGSSLNFKVVGNPQPSNPSENTIWLNTDTHIESWVFSATEPSTAEFGMVWFPVGTSSTVAFNALKKNGIQVYPLSAKQYIDGAWIPKTAKIYQGGEWVNLITYLYDAGNECEAITGGWISVQSQGSIPMGNAVRGANYLLADSNWVDNVGGTSVGWTFNNPIDVTNYKTLKFVITTNQALNSRISAYTGKSYVAMDIAYIECPLGTEKEFSLDISNVSGAYKFCFSTWAGTDMKIHKVWLE